VLGRYRDKGRAIWPVSSPQTATHSAPGSRNALLEVNPGGAYLGRQREPQIEHGGEWRGHGSAGSLGVHQITRWVYAARPAAAGRRRHGRGVARERRRTPLRPAVAGLSRRRKPRNVICNSENPGTTTNLGSTDERMPPPHERASALELSAAARPSACGACRFPVHERAAARSARGGGWTGLSPRRRAAGGRVIQAGLRSRAFSEQQITGWVYAALASLAGRRRHGKEVDTGPASDTPSPGFAVLSGRRKPPTLSETGSAGALVLTV
jgi:hypothetical protein